MTNIRHRLLIGFLLFIILPLALLGTATFMISQQLLEKRYGEYTEMTLKAISRNIYYVITEINNISDAGITNPAIQKRLSGKGVSGQSPNELLEKNSAEIELGRIFFNHEAIKYVALYKNDGTVYKTFRNENDHISYEQLTENPIMDEVTQKNGLPVWVGPSENPDLATNQTLFKQIRIVKDTTSYDNVGYLLMQIDLSELDRIFRVFHTAQEPGSRYMLINKKGEVLYDTKKQWEGLNLHRLSTDPVQLNRSYQSFKAHVDGQESLLSIYPLASNDWHLVSVASWEEISYDDTLVAKWVGTITLLCMMAALFFILFFVGRIATSMIGIVNLMKRVEQGDFSVRAKVTGKDETTRLASGFNSLVTTITHLLEEVRLEQERKKQAELALLQAQINPHFLFNTLESINVLAIQNEGKKVSQMIYRLGNILRISISGEDHISIRREIEHLKSYLEIQLFRFEDMFEYSIEIPSELLDDSIVKLTLQPLVENAIQHGFEGLERRGFISITARVAGESIEFFITDNGRGITDDVLASLAYESMKPVGVSGQPVFKRERRGLGLQNVAERTRIQYGKAYGLYICSQAGEGTTIKCTIPRYRR
ncbi:cache domain-containing sensor histidine kinase [Brevibacillus dissolubilis]|uniref:cache domain-containing sensor histidine kinase n=1 Tax=Brevibacillus dissolubilis TaxID=1844116 RepID=UPI0011179F7C|nr:sensor histidine kinase [Brevibacillus dissolubilis]